MIYHEDQWRRVLLDPESCRILVEARTGDEWIGTLDYTAPNLISLSEHFRDAVSYQFAVEALTKAGIGHSSPLWTLGHKGGETHWRRIG